MMKDKKGMWRDYLGWVLLGLGLLIFVGIAYLMISGKLSGAGDYIAHLFRIREIRG